MRLIYTSTKSLRKKQKPTRAQRELVESFNELRDRWASVPKFAHDKKPPSAPERPAQPPQERVQSPKNFIDQHGGTAKPSPRYTGTKMLGIAVMHKSSLTPVFSEEEILEIARMKKG